MADQQQPPPAPPPAGRGAAGDDSDEEWARMGLGLGDLGDQRAGDGAGVGGGANHDRPVAADGGNGGGRDLVFDRYGNLRIDGWTGGNVQVFSGYSSADFGTELKQPLDGALSAELLRGSAVNTR